MSARIAAAIFAALILFSAPVAMAAPIQIGQLPPHTERVVERAKQKPPCRNELVLTIYGAGFRGQNIKEAYAIAMRWHVARASRRPVCGSDVGMPRRFPPSRGCRVGDGRAAVSRWRAAA